MDYIRFGSRMILWFGNRGPATNRNNGHIYNDELFHFKKAISLIYGDNIKSHVTQPSHSVPCSFSNTPVAFMPAPPLLVDFQNKPQQCLIFAPADSAQAQKLDQADLCSATRPGIVISYMYQA